MNKQEITLDILKNLNRILFSNNYKSEKSCIYLYGETGIGKTHFIKTILDPEKYNIIWFNSDDNLNKQTLSKLTSTSLSNKCILSYFNTNEKKNIIVLDDFENICNNDKTIVSILIKLIRPKKTKKQKLEQYFCNPIIIINNCQTDKKILELKKYSLVYKFPIPEFNSAPAPPGRATRRH